MLIVCGNCGECVGCVDEQTNQTTNCSECPDGSYCSARFDFTGKTIDGICAQCVEKLYNKTF